MKDVSTQEFVLSNGSKAIIIISDLGMNKLCIDENIVVNASIGLPIRDDGSLMLHENVDFGCRISIWEYHNYNFKANHEKNPNFMYVSKKFESDTYSKAKNNAINSAIDELNKLNNLIVERQKKLALAY